MADSSVNHVERELGSDAGGVDRCGQQEEARRRNGRYVYDPSRLEADGVSLMGDFSWGWMVSQVQVDLIGTR